MKCLNCKNLGWGEEYPGKKFFGWCKEVRDAPELDRERECEHFVQATNADDIRRMSDEELAIWLAEWSFCADACPASTNEVEEAIGYHCPSNCKEQALTWLQQPAEEEP